jgi:hypothetical protein
VKSRFQAFAFKCNLYRYIAVTVLGGTNFSARRDVARGHAKGQKSRKVGRCTLTPPDP